MIALAELPLADEAADRAFLDVWIQDFGACTLSAADEVGIFDELSRCQTTPAELARQLCLDAPAVDAVCRALVAMGVALRIDDATFELTVGARLFWDSKSPCYRGREFDRHRDWEQHERIVQTLKCGWSPLLDNEKSFSESWKQGRVSLQTAENFTRVMHSMILTPSLAAVRSGAFSQVRHLVDVGGGSGALAAALLSHQPGCRATVMDLEPVCQSSKRILSNVLHGTQVEYYPVNFFEQAWPSDADAFCLSNILHDWPLDTCRQLLERAASALPPGGHLFVHEALLDAERCSPRMTVLFNLLMRMNHRGQQFTEPELLALLDETGFRSARVAASYSYWSLLTADKR